MASANQAQAVSKSTPRLNITPTAVTAIEVAPEPSDVQSLESTKKRKRSEDNDSSPEIGRSICRSQGVAMTGKVVAGQLMIIRADESIRIRIEKNC